MVYHSSVYYYEIITVKISKKLFTSCPNAGFMVCFHMCCLRNKSLPNCCAHDPFFLVSTFVLLVKDYQYCQLEAGTASSEVIVS